MVGAFIGSLLQSALTTALPVIIHDLQIMATTAQWLTTGYMLTTSIMIPATAFLHKRFSTRQLFLVPMSFFLAGLLIAAMAHTFPVLFFGRILQAVGYGVFSSMTQVIILTSFPPEKRGTAMGTFGIASFAAPVFGPTLAGLLTDLINWESIFWISLIVMAVDFLFALKLINNISQPVKMPFDYFSMMLCAVGFSGVMLGISGFGTSGFSSPTVYLPIVVGLLALAAFSVRQLRSQNPFLNLRILKNKEYLVAVLLSCMLLGLMQSGIVLMPIYIQIVHGFSATISGMILIPGAVILAVFSPIFGRAFDKYGIRTIALCGFAVFTASCLGMIFVDEHTPPLFIICMYILRNSGVGMTMMPVFTWGMSKLDQESTVHGTALLNTLRSISGPIFATVFVSVMTKASISFSGSNRTVANAYGIDRAFLGLTIVAALMFLIAVVFLKKKEESKESKEAPEENQN